MYQTFTNKNSLRICAFMITRKLNKENQISFLIIAVVQEIFKNNKKDYKI